MRIEGTGRSEHIAQVKRKKNLNASMFDTLLQEDTEDISNTTPPLSMEGPSFLALQEVNHAFYNPLFHRAEALLTSLEVLMEDMLLSKDSTDHQEEIKSLLQKARMHLSDNIGPLREILEEIEIRALVELAKLN